jgi:hypothetical protein
MFFPMFFRRREESATCPDHYMPVLEPATLTGYDSNSCICASGTADVPETPQSSSGSGPAFRGRPQGDLIDDDDINFLRQQRKPGFLSSAYSHDFLQESEQNPKRWCEIGIAFENNHAAIIIHDITGTESDVPDLKYEYIGVLKPKLKKFYEGDYVRRVHLAYLPGDPPSPLDLWFHILDVPRKFERYHPFCRLRMTDRVTKHIALTSLPRYYKELVSDCATFAHNILTKILTRIRDMGHITEQEYKIILKNLVNDNHVSNGAIGETEGVSRRNEALGESGAAMVAAHAGVYPCRYPISRTQKIYMQ